MGMPKVQNVEEETHAASEPHIFIHIDFDQRIISTNAQSRFQEIMLGILHFGLSMMAPNHISIFISSCLHQLAASQCITKMYIPSGPAKSVPYHHGLIHVFFAPSLRQNKAEKSRESRAVVWVELTETSCPEGRASLLLPPHRSSTSHHMVQG